MPLDLDAARQNAAALAGGRKLSVVPSQSKSAPSQGFADDLIPQLEAEDKYADETRQIDDVLDGLDILESYRRWCGKMEPDTRGKRENIMISCPLPGHEDRNPSAAVNLDQGDGGVFMCYACDEGGDKLTIAAIGLGFDHHNLNGRTYHDLRRAMVEEMGYRIERSSAGETAVPVQEEEPEEEPEEEDQANVTALPVQSSSSPTPLQPVTPLYEEEEEPEYAEPINWRNIFVNPDSFMHRWMFEGSTKTRYPINFLIVGGLMSLGLAARRDVTMVDERPVLPNLFVCIFAGSGGRKTATNSQTERLIREAFPYAEDDPNNRGVKLLPYPNSPEALIIEFDRFEPAVAGQIPVTGMINFDELKSLMTQAARKGSNILPTLMKFADGQEVIDSVSLSSGLKSARNAFASAIATTQTASLRRLLSQEENDSGFINRWLFVMGDREKPFDRYPGIDFDVVVPLIKDVRLWCEPGRKLDPCDGPGDTWELFKEHISEVEAMKAQDVVFTRVDLLYRKLVLLLCIDEMRSVPDEDILLRAHLLWQEFIRGYRTIQGHIGVTQVDACIDDIVAFVGRHLTRTGKPPKQGVIYNSLRRKYSSRIFSEAIRYAIELDRVKTISSSKGGRPTQVIALP